MSLDSTEMEDLYKYKNLIKKEKKMVKKLLKIHNTDGEEWLSLNGGDKVLLTVSSHGKKLIQFSTTQQYFNRIIKKELLF